VVRRLDICVRGQPVEVPVWDRHQRGAGCLSPVHTHDTTGAIHVESLARCSFTLGQKALRAFLDGQPFDGDPRSIVLTAHEEILLAFGTASQLPSPIPASHSFPAGP